MFGLTKYGRPPKEQHICNICRQEFDTAQKLASHKGNAKRGKTKCTATQ